MICMTMIEHDIFHTRMILCHDILHGDWDTIVKEEYRTSGCAIYTDTGSLAANFG